MSRHFLPILMDEEAVMSRGSDFLHFRRRVSCQFSRPIWTIQELLSTLRAEGELSGQIGHGMQQRFEQE